MSSKTELRLDWCSHAAAKYAVEKWHYSKSMPVAKSVFLGVWEEANFIGVVIFSWGGNYLIGSPYGLKQTEVCELVRIALTKHKSEVTKIVAIAIKILRKRSPGVRLIISYADPEEGHHGGVYQGGGFMQEKQSLHSSLGLMVRDCKKEHLQVAISGMQK